jgi:hypothetical protein
MADGQEWYLAVPVVQAGTSPVRAVTVLRVWIDAGDTTTSTAVSERFAALYERLRGRMIALEDAVASGDPHAILSAHRGVLDLAAVLLGVNYELTPAEATALLAGDSEDPATIGVFLERVARLRQIAFDSIHRVLEPHRLATADADDV